MQHNFSLEEHIIRGKVQFVEEIKTDLNKIQIIFSVSNAIFKREDFPSVNISVIVSIPYITNFPSVVTT